jgi:hypothetical protein
MDLE